MTIKLGIAPIGWTNDDMPQLGSSNTFEQAISEMSLAGFTGTEVGSKFPRDIDVLKHALEIRNMSIASAWFSSFLLSKSWEENEEAFKAHRDFLHALGSKVIVVSEQGNSIQGQIDTPLFLNKPVYTEEQWELVINGLEKYGELAHEKGMEIVYHHHMGTGIQTTEEIEYLMDNTDPDKVNLLFDTGHLVFSGEDPLYIYDKYKDRIKHIHFKDIRKPEMEKTIAKNRSFLNSVKAGTFTVPGDGMIDFAPIWEKIKDSGYDGWIVVEAEQDPDKANPYEYAKNTRAYINKVTGL
ncbi:myo-inosose-2 dehydratase [Companilactobacillus nodensis]|uniref:Inosose dehydratase n=1 Tax=Companilactobacillus nodensis DSM 19682 = JCM 14932 = NBRC 107160 TaxID=1423775 RepID=A0A0R1KAT8_9LACO|nr:myo-inosose-2 dehydratase [Companilactobacillus nodensis]KRK80814.1 inosose dehydratase [Companilactobacillus nodensis DSM 19682 = JCM 14932 = NBRC 107160]